MGKPKRIIKPIWGERLNTILEEQNITQVELAKRVLRTQQTISQIKTGKAPMTAETATLISEKFPEYSVAWIMGDQKYKSVDSEGKKITVSFLTEMRNDFLTTLKYLSSIGMAISPCDDCGFFDSLFGMVNESNGLKRESGNNFLQIISTQQYHLGFIEAALLSDSKYIKKTIKISYKNTDIPGYTSFYDLFHFVNEITRITKSTLDMFEYKVVSATYYECIQMEDEQWPESKNTATKTEN